ncbi:MAG: hypothetical protein H0T42_27020, partial [Deltaproteobacteria bacterium]|nr:hypothetical protein [Deltaproteobacteria bacterium]
MKRIGEILIANGWIEPSILQRALVKQRETGHRLCSYLVLGGVLGADDAACALGEQHGVAAALQRHLSRRDRSLATLLSPALARACMALPIGRMGTGEVIVCVRDPSPKLETQLARAMKEPIRLAVAPAHQLEELVLETYGADENEFEVDLSTGPIMSLDLEDVPDAPTGEDSLADPAMLELVDLDANGVARDASQEQLPIGNQRGSTLPPTNTTASDASGIAGSRTQTPPRSSLDAAAGIAVSRTQTPQAFDPAGIAVPRTQTPMQSGLDAAGPA